MFRYVTVKEVLRIHWRVIKTFGGLHGVRDLNLLESAVARPKAGFGNYEAYPDVFTKAAVFMFSIIKNHPFTDGNKRTGLASTILFLERNNYKLQASNQELIDVTVKIAEGKLTEEKIAEWLRNHTQSI